MKGDDSLFGDRGDDTVRGALGQDLLKGGKGNDWLAGNQGDDQLFGGEDDDQLLGGIGNDLLVGGTGDNILEGGTGLDRFWLHRKGHAVIQDFNLEDDQLEVRKRGFRAGLQTGYLQDKQFIFGSRAMNQLHRFIFDPGSGQLWFDADGNGSKNRQVAIATLTPNVRLTASHIQIV